MKKLNNKKLRAAALVTLAVTLPLCGCVNKDTKPAEPIATAVIPTVYVPQSTVVVPTVYVPQNTGYVTIQTEVPVALQTIAVNTVAPQNTPGPVAVITSVPTATPVSKSLKLGDKGDAVKALQQKLISLGFLKGKADGVFGAATEQAVKDFQKQYKLTVDGKAGDETMNKLKTAKATMKPVNTTAPTAAPGKKTATPVPRSTATPKASTYENTYLRSGDSGSKVKLMQERLISLGYLQGKATGKFDSITEKAVVAFQKRNCSYSDGIAGPQTLSALYSSGAKKASASVGSIGIQYKKGDSDEKIKAIQNRLKTLGYYNGTCDGVYGSDTVTAVRLFQKNNGLTVDGIVADATLEKLNSTSAVRANATATPRVTAKPTATPKKTATPNPYHNVTKAPNVKYVILVPGNNGTLVQNMQKELKKQGYFQGNTDGYYGEVTERAVIAFQKAKGLKQTGIADVATQTILFEGNNPEGS